MSKPNLPKCVKVYRARDGWRWRIRARNGRILADGAEAYKERRKCLDGAMVMCGLMVKGLRSCGWPMA